MTTNDTEDATFVVKEIFPVMKGNANMARGAGYFEVPLFSHVRDTLWQGCSPAEFPDELEEFGYDYRTLPYQKLIEIERKLSREPANCKWLLNDDDPRFNFILNLYVWGKYVVPPGVEYHEVEMYDSGGLPDRTQIDSLARTVVTAVQSEVRTLVHCQAGLNRSSLVVARALMLGWDMSADEAISTVRIRSETCFCNETFEAFLRSLYSQESLMELTPQETIVAIDDTLAVLKTKQKEHKLEIRKLGDDAFKLLMLRKEMEAKLGAN